VVLDVEKLQVYSLNETGNFLVECLAAGATSEEELVERLVAEFEVELERAREDVRAFVDELTAKLSRTASDEDTAGGD
jgi:hypothetical protein